MVTLQTLALALGLAALAGINLYLTVFVTGMAVRFEWIQILPQYQSLEILGHPAIITVAGVLYFLEFFADKVPWVDSMWDAVHTVIRPVGATLLAIQVLGQPEPVFDVVVGLLAGGTALTVHGLKAGSRLLVNGSPEPFSNIALSVGEDVAVLGGLYLLHADPVLALIVFAALIAVALYFFPRFWRSVRLRLWLIWKKLNAPADDQLPVELGRSLPADCDVLLARIAPEGSKIDWAIRCHAGKMKGIPPHVPGWLVALAGGDDRLYWVAKRRFGRIAKALEVGGHKVSREPRFLSEDLILYSREGGSRLHFVFDRGDGGRLKTLTEDLERRFGGGPTQDPPLPLPDPAAATA